MFNDKYLRFDNEAAAQAVLYTAKETPVFDLVPVAGETIDVWVYQDSDGNQSIHTVELSPAEIAEDGLTFVRKETEPTMESQQTGVTVELTPKFRNIDVLGTIYETAPNPVPEDYVPVALDGWHVNVRVIDGEDASVLEPYSVIPTNPRRIWWS